MRYALAILLFIIATLSPFAESSAAEVGQNTFFIVTAYYSPLPNQLRYATGDYGRDKILNGNGTHGASGRPVYVGMLAAPKSYAFGTQIYLEGLWTGQVDDRGGAIVDAGVRNNAYDRIDVWMGEGDEGLSRALAWGRRTVRGRIVSGGKISLSAASFPRAAQVKSAGNSTTVVSAPLSWEKVLSSQVSKQSSSESIRILKKSLSDLGYASCAATGGTVWNNTFTQCLISFQLKEKIIASRSEIGAGVFGPKTRAKILALYRDFDVREKDFRAQIERERLALEQRAQSWQQKYSGAIAAVAGVTSPRSLESGAHIRSLQEGLKTLGYYSDRTTGVFGPKTQAAYQLWRASREEQMSVASSTEAAE